jgi:hypothetical protein
MSTRIDEREMTSSATGHRAVVVDGADQYDPGAWRVSWLPDVALNRDQAITAMTLVEFVAKGVTSSDHPKWPFVKGWAYELDLNPAEAVQMILAKTDEAGAANERARPDVLPGDVLPGHEDQAAQAMREHLAELDRQRQRVAAAVDHVREHGTIRLPDLPPDVANHVLAVLWSAHDDPATTAERRDALYPLVDLLQQAMTVSYEQTTN